MSNEGARQLVDALCSALQGRIESIEALQALVQPVLQCFNLASAPPASTSSAGSTGWQTLSEDNKAYILRTAFPDIQRVLATKIIVDWHDRLLQRDHAGHTLLDTLWKPFFCPPSTSASLYAVSIALSAYPVLLEILANKQDRLQGLSSTQIKPASLHPLVQSIAIATLADLSSSFNIRVVFGHFARNPAISRSLLDWQAFVNLYTSIPVRLANFASDLGKDELDSRLEWRRFYLRLSRHAEALMAETAIDASADSTSLQSLSFLLCKLVRSGFFQLSPGLISFWPAIWNSLQAHLVSSTPSKTASKNWQACLASLTSSELVTFSSTFLAQCQTVLDNAIASETSQMVKRLAMLSIRIFGSLGIEGSEDVCDVVVKGILLGRQVWGEDMARMLVAWTVLSDEGDNKKGNGCVSRLIDATLPLWAEKAIIEKGSESYHAYLTTILCLLIDYLPPLDASIVSLSRSPIFLKSITAHLSCLRPAIRLSGMYIAELVSQKSLDPNGTVKPLDFAEIWEDKIAPGMQIVEALRQLRDNSPDWKVEGWEVRDPIGVVEEADEQPCTAKGAPPAPLAATSGSKPKPIGNASKIQVISSSTEDDDDGLADEYNDYDSSASDEDDLQPYALPAAPAKEDLVDLEDPSTYTPNKKKVQPPVYIADLSAMLKQSEDAEKLAVGLKEAESLIRRKAGWGSELEDNAVDLAFTLTGLQDNFSLEGFEDLRRNALTALTVACPTKSTPAVIEQYFSNQYSINQKFAMLSSLAIGARELAGLPTILPPASSTLKRVSEHRQESDPFPSQRLPGKLHEHFLAAAQASSNARPRQIRKERDNDAEAQFLQPETPHLDAVQQSITDLALSDTRASAEQAIPEAGREKLLTVRATKTKILKPVSLAKASSIITAKNDTTAVQPASFAALATESFIMPLMNRFWLYMRDVATSPQQVYSKVGPYAGGLAGVPAVLEPLLLSKFLSTLAVLLDAGRNSPHFLAVLVPEALELVLAIRHASNDHSPEVENAALQLTLIVLDASIAIDSGRTLARDFGKLTWQIKDWAEAAWSDKEQSQLGGKGEIMDSGGRAAAGVLLRLDQVVAKSIGYR